MAAVDVPVHLGLGGHAAGEFSARPGPRRLAVVASRWVLFAGAAAIALIVRRPWDPHASLVVGSALMFIAFAAVGLAVRRAHVTVAAGGIRWGWRGVGVTIERDRIRAVDVYRDAIAIRQRRGSSWFLTAHDWARFDALVVAVERSGWPVSRHDRGAPLAARLQSYGRVLDGLLAISIAGSTALAVVAAV
jgi:hypothetical protein